MLEKPDLADEKIIACLRQDYSIGSASLEFLPLGHDADAAVYRVVAEDGNAYFLKLKRSGMDEISLTIPHFLKTRGIEQVIAPLPTRDGRLRTALDDYALLLYPFVEGSSGKEIGLTDAQWREFGTVVRKMHGTTLTDDLAARLPKESFVPKTSHIKAVEAKIDAGEHGNAFARDLAAFWIERRDQIQRMVDRAETLGRQLQAQRHAFVLCHADMHTANVLIGTDGKLWIVDWDTPMLAPKERDLLVVTGVGIGGAVAPGERGEALFYSGYGTTKIDRMALAYYRYDWALQDIGEFGAAIFVTQDVSEETLQDAANCLTFSFTPGSVGEAARQIDDWV